MMKENICNFGKKCLFVVLFVMIFAGTQAMGHLPPQGSFSLAILNPSGNKPETLEISRLPGVRDVDPAVELAMISRHQMEKLDHGRLIVAMRLGDQLDLGPVITSDSRAGGNSDLTVEQGYGEGSHVEDMIQVSAASFEDEKVIDEPEDWDEDVSQETIADPLEPINRVFFAFNDKLYFWVLKPVARGYRYVIPEPFRVGFRNMFTNIAMPIRAVNCLLQGKFKGLGRELLRFVVNSTAGFFGFVDAAKIGMHLEAQDEDFGQTLGVFGAGPGIYINWPIFGPSSIRDTFGLAGDFFADPLTYLVTGTRETIAVRGGDRVNRTSLTIGDYESLKKSALDPYVSVRDAYFQYRRAKIEK
ncbi:MAG TPA: VacJ family lipoprotein [Desulfobacteraceae bacterium]|nr:MAG: VacJ family lipoprotein [Deltaproteobacteria bacterium]HDZ22946.1 VacJ family lipoprotein [Desulfobacteraceae bacterium]